MSSNRFTLRVRNPFWVPQETEVLAMTTKAEYAADVESPLGLDEPRTHPSFFSVQAQRQRDRNGGSSAETGQVGEVIKPDLASFEY